MWHHAAVPMPATVEIPPLLLDGARSVENRFGGWRAETQITKKEDAANRIEIRPGDLLGSTKSRRLNKALLLNGADGFWYDGCCFWDGLRTGLRPAFDALCYCWGAAEPRCAQRYSSTYRTAQGFTLSKCDCGRERL